ncbi:XkdX family protein [Lacticaseibacillus porcinae]
MCKQMHEWGCDIRPAVEQGSITQAEYDEIVGGDAIAR